MFRGNRIGTPTYHNQLASTSTVTTALYTNTPDQVLRCNCMNGTPLTYLDRIDLNWRNTGTPKSLPAGNRGFLAAQITVGQPVRGNVVGIEVDMAMVVSLPGVLVYPAFSELTTVGGAFFAAALTNGAVTPLNQDYLAPPPAAGTQAQAYQCRDQVIIEDTVSGSPAGNYAAGFVIDNRTASAVTFTDLQFYCYVRQGLDQPNKAYVDTRR